ncbi:hypothetical protein EG347_01155 [Chryseobacterium sp. G0186]|nr:hypothetical protein EG347_01155 [Chryseobacterium sp. G0186]
MEHSVHHTKFAKTNHHQKEKGATFSKDDNCQCTLHLQMNHTLLTEPLAVKFTINPLHDDWFPRPKVIRYYSLLYFLNSRPPPFQFYPVA